jgi:hypothetical protein
MIEGGQNVLYFPQTLSKSKPKLNFASDWYADLRRARGGYFIGAKNQDNS